MKKIILLSIICIFTLNFLNAQTAEERLLQKREQRLLNYSYQAKVGSMTDKIQVIDNILNEFDKEKYSYKDKKLLDLAVFLSEEGTVRQEYEENRLVNNFPEVRRKACVLLGKLKGDEARNAVINILAHETNSSVKAEACNALAQLGDNDKGEALRAIVYAYRTSYKPDRNFVFAVISAVKAIAKGNASSYADALLILSEVQMGYSDKFIREEAYKAIQYLNSEN